MKIRKIKLSALHNEEHYQFMTEVKLLIDSAATLASLNIDPLLVSFQDMYGKENAAIEAFRKSMLTDPIAEADKRRDDIYRGLTLYIDSCSYSLQADKVRAAHNIQVVIDHYGDFRNKNYNEETACITNFLQDLNARCSADILLLDATARTGELAAANQAFSALMNSRYDDNAVRISFNLREVRLEIDHIYARFANCLNNYIAIHGDLEYNALANLLNERIDYFKNTLVQRRGRLDAKKEKEAGAGSL